MDNYTRSYSLSESPLLQRLQNNRLIGKFIDIILKVGDNEFPAHRIVLDNSSPVFQKLFSNRDEQFPSKNFDWIEFSVYFLSKFDEKVTMKNKIDIYELDKKFIRPEIMEDLLTFLYTSKILITPKNVHSILIAAEYLQIPLLLQICEQYFTEIFSPCDILDQFFLAEMFKFEEFSNYCVKSIISNVDDIFRTKQFYHLEVEDLKTLLCRLISKIQDDINEESGEILDETYEEDSDEEFDEKLIEFSEEKTKDDEEDDEEDIEEQTTILNKSFLEIMKVYTLYHKIYESVIAWVDFDRVNRLSSSNALLKCIPLQILFYKLDFFEKFISENSFSKIHPCSKSLIKVISQKLRTKICEDSDLFEKKRQLQENFERIFETEINSGENTRIYCFGGDGNYPGTVSFMDVSSGKWRKVANMTSYKLRIASVAVGSNAYLCGGNNYLRKTNDMEMFNCETHTWTQFRPMPQIREGCSAAMLNGYIYVAGGQTKTLNNSEAYSSVIRYNIQTDQWETVQPMNQKRWEHQLIELDGFLYAIGGFNGSKNVEEYCPLTNQWTEKAKMNFFHYHFSATSHGGKIYVCSQKGFEVYSPESDSWKQLTPLNDYDQQKLVSVNNKLLAIGGQKCYESTSAVFSYDPTTDQWTQLPDMDTPRSGHCSIVIESPKVK